MNRKGLIRVVIILSILAVNVGCDQFSKAIVRSRLDVYDHISFLNNHFNILKVENTGAFLSLGDNLHNPYRFVLLTLLPLLALLGTLLYILIKNNITRLTLVGIILVLGGGIGNIYDRVVHGSVTDFMHINFGFFETGIFNVADVSIMTGIGFVFFERWFGNKIVNKQPVLR